MDKEATYRLGLFALVAAIIMTPSFLWGPGDSHSVAYNYMWTSQFGSEMAQGHLYPRWLPRSFEGLGSPTFYFYPPLAYWIAGSFDAIGFSTLAAINIAAFIVLTLSGVAMHAWLASRGTRPVLGAILYMAAPYHLMDFYIRGALAEFTAFIWLPLIALGISHVHERRGVVILALSYAAMILTHLPLAMLTGFFLIAPLGLHRIWRDRATLVPLASAGALAIGLAHFYLLPALTLQDKISSELLWGAYYRPSAWSLLTPNSLLTGLSSIPALALGMALLAWKARSIWTIITVLTALAALGLIPYMWDVAPLSRAQFPWRLLCIVEFAGLTALLSIRRISPALLGIGAGLTLYPFINWIPHTAEYLESPVPYAMLAREVPDAPEYLPAGFDTRLVREIDRKADLRAWRDVRPGSQIEVREAGEVMVRRADFPIWQVMRGDKVVAHKGPIIHFQATPGVYRLERVRIWQETAGAFVSLLSALILAIAAHGRLPRISPLIRRSSPPLLAPEG